MEGDESGLSSYYHHNHHHHNHNNTTGTSNGLFSNPHQHNNHHQQHQHQQHQQQQQQQQQQQHNQSSAAVATHFSSEPTPLIFSQHSSVTGRAPVASSTPPPPETIRRKRGRPRKYGTSSETTPQSATASTASAKKLSSTTSPSPSSASLPLSSPPRKKEPSSSTVSSPKKAQLLALGNAGQGFTPHVITVAAGEDVAQKIMSFMQQRKRAVCILSASGSISNASLRQPATLGGNVTYEGRFEILSLSGSFLHTEIGGASSRTGGLSVCLSGTDGRIVGGGVGGPLKAAGPVQVIAGSFVFDAKKEANIDFKGETSANKLPPSIGGATVSSSGFRTTTSVRGNDDHQHMGGNSFMLQARGMHPIPTRQNDWRSALDDLGACRSPEDGDDEHLRD